MSAVVNGASLLATCGLIVAQGKRSTPEAAGRDVQVASAAGAYGGYALLQGTGGGELGIDGTVVGAPNIASGDQTGASNAQLLANLAALRQLTQGDQAVGLGNMPDREWHGHLKSMTASYNGADEVAVSAAVSLRWAIPDPLAIAVAETVLPGTDVALALGNAPTPLRVELYNSGGTPITQVVVAVLRGGVALQSFTWTGSIAAAASWVLDDEGATVTNAGANAIDGVAASSVFPIADPLDAANRVTVALTGGTAAVCVRYHKRWLG